MIMSPGEPPKLIPGLHVAMKEEDYMGMSTIRSISVSLPGFVYHYVSESPNQFDTDGFE